MDRKTPEIKIARRVTLAIREAGVDAASVARAADITSSDLSDRLNGHSAFRVHELVRVGGFLHVSVPDFFKEAA